MNNDIRILSNGTKTFNNVNGETMHECQYCGTWFIPKRRFVQKFCKESCRVMSCRKRKEGLFGVTGGNVNQRNNVTNQTLVNYIEELRNEVKQSHEINENLKDEVNDIIFNQKISDAKSDKILRNIEYNLFASILLPFLAEPIKNKFKELFSSNEKPNTFEEFETKIKPFKKAIPEALQKQITEAAQAYYVFKDVDPNNFNSMP